MNKKQIKELSNLCNKYWLINNMEDDTNTESNIIVEKMSSIIYGGPND